MEETQKYKLGETRKKEILETEELTETMDKIQKNKPVTKESLNELWDKLLEEQEKKKVKKKVQTKLNK